MAHINPSEAAAAASDGSNDDNWSDWEEDDTSAAICPFCSFTGPAAAVFEHSAQTHSFDFYELRRQLGLDFYGSMRLVNFIRKTKMSAVELLAQPRAWLEDDQYLVPVFDDDPLLYAFDADEGDDEISAIDKPVQQDALANDPNLIQNLLKELHLNQSKLEKVTAAFQDYKEEIKKTFMSSEVEENETGHNKLGSDWEMDGYFNSYAYTEIHETMLKDAVRTDAYRNFIYNNKAYFKDKIVLDVGCGTGVLSMFAAKAGAKQVIAVDNSTIINKARAIAAANGLDGVITFIAGKIEEVVLPVQKVDLIVSEWMGYFLLFEGMLDSVLVARDLYLKPDGIMAPSHAIIKIAGIDDEDWINDKLHFWNNVYGFNMEIMKQGFLTDGQVDFADPKSIITDECSVVTIETGTATVKDLDFESDFSLTVTRNGTLHAICGWFDIEFRGAHQGTDLVPELFSTGPLVKGTHWKQTMFVLDQPQPVSVGDIVTGHFIGVKSPEHHRDMVVTISIEIRSRGIKLAAKSFNVR
eukprot:jgi/Hompol1/3086/HPOL_003116-RA